MENDAIFIFKNFNEYASKKIIAFLNKK